MDTLGDSYILIPQDFGMIPGHELVTKVCLFVTFSCLRSQTLYKEKLLQYLDIVGVVHLLSISVQRFCDPPGILLRELPR